MSEDPRVTAKKKEAHELLVAKVRAIHEIKMRVAQARMEAIQQARATHELAVHIARHNAKVAAARSQAHAEAAGRRVEMLKAAQAQAEG
jgi:hypothetical protein